MQRLKGNCSLCGRHTALMCVVMLVNSGLVDLEFLTQNSYSDDHSFALFVGLLSLFKEQWNAVCTFCRMLIVSTNF